MTGYQWIAEMYDEMLQTEREHVTVFERFLSDARAQAKREQPVLDALKREVDMPLLWEGID